LEWSLNKLGTIKAGFETLWLALPMLMFLLSMINGESAMIALAFGFLLGCGLYGLLAIWMLVAHIMLYRGVRSYSRRCRGGSGD
jgi:hypothetical protein